MNKIQVPFVNLVSQYMNFREELIEEFDKFCKRGEYILSETLLEFEERIAEYCETKFALGVGNGSDALFLVMKALGIGRGDEVITCPNSFYATAWAIVATGAKPVFVDVREDYNMDADKLENVITDRTKAIVPVHLTGRPARMDQINKISKKYNLHVIEDAAQAIGARFKGKRVGSFGIAAGFSLHPVKNLSVYGDGGIITTNKYDLYDKLKKLRNHGLVNRDECVLWGYNSRLDPLQAGFASIKLKKLESRNERCREIAEFYCNQLRDYVWVPKDDDSEESVYHNYIIKTEYRDELSAFLSNQGIGSCVHYPIPIHLQQMANDLGYKVGDFPITERLAKTMLSLPIYPELSENEISYVTENIVNYFIHKHGKSNG